MRWLDMHACWASLMWKVFLSFSPCSRSPLCSSTEDPVFGAQAEGDQAAKDTPAQGPLSTGMAAGLQVRCCHCRRESLMSFAAIRVGRGETSNGSNCAGGELDFACWYIQKCSTSPWRCEGLQGSRYPYSAHSHILEALSGACPCTADDMAKT